MAALACARLDTPVGWLLAVTSERGLCGLPFVAADPDAPAGARLPARLQRRVGAAALVEQPDHPILRETQAWLTAYFAGANDGPALPPLDMRGGDFERAVWRSLLDIPIGTTTSYGTVARRIGHPGAARAVGLANGANPIAIVIPCHRLIGSDGSLTGYGGGMPRKRWLLEHEGALQRRAP